MKNMKRVLILVLALIMAFGVVEAASAVGFNFTFTNITETVNTESGSVRADASYYIVDLGTASTASSTNVFGFRARKTDGNAYASSYRTMDYVGKKTVYYYSDVTEGTSVYLKCKKDDSSAYGGPLNASGTFTP